MGINVEQVLADDRERRRLRQLAEDSLLSNTSYVPEGVDPYHFSRSIKGVPSNKHRIVKASKDCWSAGMRGKTVGVAPGTEQVATEQTVAVTVNGTTTIVPASAFKATSIHKKQRHHATQVADTRKRITAADLAPIGNIE